MRQPISFEVNISFEVAFPAGFNFSVVWLNHNVPTTSNKLMALWNWVEAHQHTIIWQSKQSLVNSFGHIGSLLSRQWEKYHTMNCFSQVHLGSFFSFDWPCFYDIAIEQTLKVCRESSRMKLFSNWWSHACKTCDFMTQGNFPDYCLHFDEWNFWSKSQIPSVSFYLCHNSIRMNEKIILEWKAIGIKYGFEWMNIFVDSKWDWKDV